MNMTERLYDLFRRTLPYIVREEATALAILGDKDNHIISRRDDSDELIGACVVNKNNIYLICVDEKYRGRGIGAEMLKEAEEYVRANGYDTITVGAGDDYLMPGVPCKSMVFEENPRA